MLRLPGRPRVLRRRRRGAIGIARNANKARKEPLRVILNGLGKDAAQIISRINGFTYVQTQFDYFTGELKIVRESRTPRASGLPSSATAPTTSGGRSHHAPRGRGRVHHRQLHQPHPVPASWWPAPIRRECIEQGKKYFSVASGGGTGRTLHPDNMAAGPPPTA